MTQLDDSLVSVIVPAWNAGRTLAETLASAAAQSHGNIEVLIVDDGSEDGTAEIAMKFCEADSRFRFVSKPRGGLSSARNRGIDNASGAWLAPLDADDLWHPEKLERQLRTFAESPAAVGLVYCWYRMIDEDGRVTERAWAPVMEGSVFAEHLTLNVGTGSSPLIRRTALGDKRYSSELSSPDEGGCEDWLLQLQIAAEFDVACTRAFLVGYRARADSMSADKMRMMRAHIRMYEMLGKEFPGRHRGIIEGELARWQALYDMEQPDEAGPSSRGRLARAAASILSSASGSKRLRFRRASVGRSFFDLSPDAA